MFQDFIPNAVVCIYNDVYLQELVHYEVIITTSVSNTEKVQRWKTIDHGASNTLVTKEWTVTESDIHTESLACQWSAVTEIRNLWGICRSIIEL